MSGARHDRLNTAGLSMAMWNPGETSATRPPCTAVSRASRSAWVSDDPDARALAREACLHCPIRLTCLRMALDSGAEAGVFGGYSLGSAPERRLARQELKRGERQEFIA